MYVYPLEFESQTISRRALVKNSYFAIILFQTGMALIGFTRQDPVSNKVGGYWLGLIAIQLFVIVITFEFMRKPWEGVEIELEKILQLQQQKILEDSISAMSVSQAPDLSEVNPSRPMRVEEKSQLNTDF